MTVFAVRVQEIDPYVMKTHVFLIEASNENQAKNLAEAKWYELHPKIAIAEGKTQIWTVEQDYANNPSVR